MSGSTSLRAALPDALSKRLAVIQTCQLKFADLPVIEPDERALIPAAIEQIERTLLPASPDQIDAALGLMATVLPMKKTPEDMERMYAVYEKALEDVPGDVIEMAAMEAIKTLKFFPRVAELRELALPEMSRRKYRKVMLEMLARKHDEEWREPAELVKPEQLSRLHKRLSTAFPSKRDAA